MTNTYPPSPPNGGTSLRSNDPRRNLGTALESQTRAAAGQVANVGSGATTPIHPEDYALLGYGAVKTVTNIAKNSIAKGAAAKATEKEIQKQRINNNQNADLDNVYTVKNQTNFKEIEIIDAKGSPMGELDGIDLKNKVFYEDKAAQGLKIINPRTGKPQQTAMQFANKQIYRKTKERILNIREATGTRVTKEGSSVAPSLAEIKEIKQFVFRLDGDSPELRKALNKSMANLKRDFPDYDFKAIYGVK